MREAVREVVADLAAPSAAAREEAIQNGGSAAAHGQYMAEWPVMTSLEFGAPPPAAEVPVPEQLLVTAWNIERCRDVAGSAEVLRSVGADVVLATEMDRGMARTGQRHTTRALAEALGFGYVYGVEFVELGLGDPVEAAAVAGERNAEGLHGNAILSRWPLQDAALLPIDDGGAWYVGSPKGDGQHRVGGRMAMAGRIETAAGPLLLVSVHYESESDAAGRARQTEAMLAQMRGLYGDVPAVIGGDLNTAGFHTAGLEGAAMLAAPEAVEPSFAALAAAGFDWRTANTGAVTTRVPPWRPVARPLKTLDWLFVRGVAAEMPFVTPAVTDAGAVLSDHELVGARVLP